MYQGLRHGRLLTLERNITHVERTRVLKFQIEFGHASVCTLDMSVTLDMIRMNVCALKLLTVFWKLK